LYFAKEHRFNSGKALKQPLLIIMGLFVSSQLMSAQNQWTTPLPIDTSRYCCPFGGEMALDDSDNIYVTFSAFETNKLFMVRSTDKGSTWMQYTYSGTELSRIPRDIVVDHKGNVWLLWISVDYEFAPTYVNLSKSTDSGKTFATVFRSLSYADGLLYQKLAVDNQNSIYMLWDDVHFEVTRFRDGDIAQRFDGEILRDTFSIGSYPAFAVSNDNVVHCAWEGSIFDSANEYHKYVFYSSSVDSGKTFQGRIRVDTSAGSQVNYDVQHYPALAIDSTGIVFISYTKELQVNNREIRIVHSVADGSFDTPLGISGTDTAYESTMCVDSEGGINMLWSYEGANGGGTRHYRSFDGGGTFTEFAPYPYIGFYSVNCSRNGFLFATGASDSGIVFSKIGLILSVSEEPYQPNTLTLLPNYPNPFNGSTIIRFSIGARSFVHLEIFDITGREVEALLSRAVNPGSYSITWNANRFSSGVYFVCLMTENKFLIMRKMIYMR
jgi:hypothetical protein